MGFQEKWTWCNKCQVLCFSGGSSPGPCPAGGQHDHVGSGNYALVDTEPMVPGQDNWRWCSKCQALAFAGHDLAGQCSAGGRHDHNGSGNYNLLQYGSGAPGQRNWRWCNKCEVLAFGGGNTAGACAAGGEHDYSGSGDYVLVQLPDCSSLLQQVRSLEHEIERIQSSSDYLEGPRGKPAPDLLTKVRNLQRQLTPKASAYTQCVTQRQVLLDLDRLRLLPRLRHFGPEPLWIMGHNTNSIEQVHVALNQGANAVEIDVNVYAHDPNTLCIEHDPGAATAPELKCFLQGLRQVADNRSELCMVMFDIKPPAALPKFGPVLRDAIRNILTKDTELSIILSVADVVTERVDSGTVFDNISDDVRTHEGFMIDECSNLDKVVTFFAGKKVTRFGYGNGTSFPFSDEGAMVYRTPIEEACWRRAVQDGPGFVDAWTVNSIDNLRLYLRLGVNGLICDPQGIERVRSLLQQSEFRNRYRLARRFDDPMEPDNFAYGLTVVTTDRDGAGTDANITFTLSGDNGSASTRIDSNFNARMEAGMVNFIVLHSPDLGTLRSIAVQSDMSGNAPGWHLASIEVQSKRYGVNKKARFNVWIESTAPVTRAFE